MRRLNPLARALVMAGVFALAILAAQYTNQIIVNHATTFEPDWPILAAGCALSFAFSLVQLRYGRR